MCNVFLASSPERFCRTYIEGCPGKPKENLLAKEEIEHKIRFRPSAAGGIGGCSILVYTGLMEEDETRQVTSRTHDSDWLSFWSDQSGRETLNLWPSDAVAGEALAKLQFAPSQLQPSDAVGAWRKVWAGK
eukprot:Skav212303  [mRNA]  locus=scaffold732:701428:705337:- [translate_table: standard]